MVQAVIKKSHSRMNLSGRLSKKITLFGFFLIVFNLLIWGGTALFCWIKEIHRLPLSWWILTGDYYYTTYDDIRKAIISLPLDINLIQKNIENLQWVKHVCVHIRWPDAIKIHLVEYQPVARWNDVYLLDIYGNVFSVPTIKKLLNHQKIPFLYGPQGSEKYVLSLYHTLNQVLSSEKYSLSIKTLSMSTRYSSQLILQDDKDHIRLELGCHDKIRRLKRFITVYPILLEHAKNDNKRIIHVDLRYNSGIAVGWEQKFKANNHDQSDGQKTSRWTRNWHSKSSCASRRSFT